MKVRNLLCILMFLSSVMGFSFSCKSKQNVCEENYNSTMPVIKINSEKLKSEKKNNDFVTKPVASTVKSAKLTWGEIDNSPDPYYKLCRVTVENEEQIITLDNVLAEVKVRGNWTTNYNKKPLRIKFNEKQNILNLNEGNKFKNWVLLASYKDWSFMRDITGYTIGRILSPDYYSSDYKLVEVYVNDEYWGVYVLVEQQEIDENRINLDDAEENSSVKTGYVIEYDNYFYQEDINTIFTINYGTLFDRNNEEVLYVNNGYTIKNDLNEKTGKNQRDYIESYMRKLWKICYDAIMHKKYIDIDGLPNDTVLNTKDFLSKYVDIESLVDTYILHEIVCDPDVYLTSFYMTIDLASKKRLTFEAPWDFDSTMGNKRHLPNEQGLYAGVVGMDVNYEKRGSGNPWLILFARENWFMDMVKSKWNEKKDLIFDQIIAQISELTEKHTACFERNQKRWKNIGVYETIGNELSEESRKCKTQQQAAVLLIEWLEERKKTFDMGINSL